MPIIKREGATERQENKGLSKFSDWTWSNIQEEELKNALLPKMIATKKKPIYKPSYW